MANHIFELTLNNDCNGNRTEMRKFFATKQEAQKEAEKIARKRIAWEPNLKLNWGTFHCGFEGLDYNKRGIAATILFGNEDDGYMGGNDYFVIFKRECN